MNVRRIGTFLGLAFGLSWAVFGAFTLLGGTPKGLSWLYMAVAFMYGPAAAALIATKLLAKESIKSSLGLTLTFNRWLVAAWLIFPALAFIVIVVGFALPGVRFDPEMVDFIEKMKGALPPEVFEKARVQQASMPVHPFWVAAAAALLAGPTANAVAALGEEVGWRGYLLRELAGVGFWRSSYLIGAVWGVWHAPIILGGHNYPQHPVAGAFMMVAFCVLLSPLLSYVRMRAGTVIAAAVMHGSLNAVAGVPLLITAGGSDLSVGFTGAAGLLVLAGANGALYLWKGGEPA